MMTLKELFDYQVNSNKESSQYYLSLLIQEI